MATRQTAEERDRAAVEAAETKRVALAWLDEIKADDRFTAALGDQLGRYLLTARKRGAAESATPRKRRGAAATG